MKISLATYSIGIFNNKESKYLNLDKVMKKNNVSNEFISFEELFKEFLDYGKNVGFNNETMKKILSFLSEEEIDINESNGYCGLIESGNYGYETSFINIDENEKKRIKKPKEYAELIKFFFALCFPANSERHFLILERFNYFGIKTIFERELNRFFKIYMKKNDIYNQYMHLRIEINNLMPKKIVEEIIDKGKISKLRFISYNKLKSIEDKFGKSPSEEKEYSELIIRKDTPKLKNSIKKLLNNKMRVKDLVEFKDYEYDDLKIEVIYGNSKKVIDMSNIFKMKAFFDITDKVDIDIKTGIPTYDSLKVNFVEELNYLLEEYMEGNKNDD